MFDEVKFAIAFSERAYKENDLSDITYAMCEADMSFRKYFLDFFFKDANLDARTVTIHREYSTKFGRPDFFIRTRDGTGYIVEVKIENRSHHFEDYCRLLVSDSGQQGEHGNNVWKRIGYITNYDDIKDVKVGNRNVTELCGKVATWSEFVQGITQESPATCSFIEYVNNVCRHDTFKIGAEWKISLKDFRDIRAFDIAIEDAIKHCGCVLFNTGRSFKSQFRMGHFFEWKGCGATPIVGWIGAYYTNSGAALCIEFEDRKGWGDVVCERYNGCFKGHELRVFAVNSEHLDKGQISKFLASVLGRVKNGFLFEQDCVMCIEDVIGHSASLMAMKCLPHVLERYLIEDDFEKKLQELGYNMELRYISDQENPKSHCGRYFELRLIDGVGKTDALMCSHRCWVGVLYNKSCKRNKGENFGDVPGIVLEIGIGLKCPNSWGENTWGWRYCEISDERTWREVIKDVRGKILDIIRLQLHGT